MKVGIYITGLGQSFANDSVEKYTTRLMDEMSYNTVGAKYEIKIEKINYAEDRESSVVSIIEKNEPDTILYKIYDFQYHEIITEKFNKYSIIVKNFWLLILVITKFPMIIKRLFLPTSFRQTWQTLYLFSIFIIISLAIILMLPATISIGSELMSTPTVDQAITTVTAPITDIVNKTPQIIPVSLTEQLAKILIPLTTISLLFIPGAKVLITNLATEFVCANDYIEHGAQKQLIQGNLEKLVDYISEHEDDCKIHFHSYSFGSLIAIDYIYPYGNSVSRNANIFCDAIITIGTPFEFVKSYYSKFYANRKKELGDKLCWLNVYSTQDMLGTNFRRDSKSGEADFGIDTGSTKPININYEVAHVNPYSPLAFFTLYNIKVHNMYWDPTPSGQSCLRLIHTEMKKNNLI